MMKAESRLGRRKLEDFRGKSVLKELHRLFNSSKATMRLPTLSSVRLLSNGAYVNQLLIFLLSLPRGLRGMTISLSSSERTCEGFFGLWGSKSKST